MELNIAPELKIAGRIGNAHLCGKYPDMELAGGAVALSKPVELDVKYSFDGEAVTLTGTLASAVRMNCTKCNEEIIRDFSVDFSERFLKVSENEAEELECYAYSGDTLDLDRMVHDLVLLNAPMYGTCKPGCKGLCPVCGTNLNKSQCSCSRVDESNPFAALLGLKELLKDD